MKLQVTGYIVWEKWSYQTEGKIGFQTYPPSKDISSREQVLIREHEFEVEVPDDFDPRPGLIASLKESAIKARADYTELVTTINRRIQELLSIEG